MMCRGDPWRSCVGGFLEQLSDLEIMEEPLSQMTEARRGLCRRRWRHASYTHEVFWGYQEMVNRNVRREDSSTSKLESLNFR